MATAISKGGTFELVLLPKSYGFMAIDPQHRYATMRSSWTVVLRAAEPIPAVTITVAPRQRRHAAAH